MDRRTSRLSSLDALRGVVMIVMALDHVRDFFHADAQVRSPTDMATTTPAVFLTRWVTHFCAPVFLLTAGMAAYLWMARNGRTASDLSRFLVTRGAWLVLVEVVVMRLGFDFTFGGSLPVLLITLWALGGSMVVLAALVHLPVRLLALLSLAGIGLHDLLDPIAAARFGAWAWAWNMVHQPGVFRVGGVPVLVGYPLLPLTATMAAGFCLGRLYERPPSERQRFLVVAGAMATAAFLVVRSINVYGDPAPWSTQPSSVMTMLSFLNCTKYPASLDFLLMTLGPALMLLAWLDRRRFGESSPLVVFGRTPLFYFVVHFFWIHAVLVVASWFRYGSAWFSLLPVPSMGGPRDVYPASFGYGLLTTYLVWILVVVTMYPACRWFAGVKKRRHGWWVSYL